MRMKNMKVVIWLFTILFIFHDFEEIIFMQSWISKNRRYLCERFPALSKGLLPHFDNIATSSFAFGAAEEFILIRYCCLVFYFSLSAYLLIAFIISNNAGEIEVIKIWELVAKSKIAWPIIKVWSFLLL